MIQNGSICWSVDGSTFDPNLIHDLIAIIAHEATVNDVVGFVAWIENSCFCVNEPIQSSQRIYLCLQVINVCKNVVCSVAMRFDEIMGEVWLGSGSNHDVTHGFENGRIFE